MYIKYVLIENIRNHIRTEIVLEPNLNVFFGPNGSGKTSILEAISISTFSKSFVTNYDHQIVRHNENYYSIEIGAETDSQIPFTIRVIYQLSKGKEIRDSSGELLSSQNLIGRIPIVVLSPDMKQIIFGPPSERREFVDKIISQTDQYFLQKLINYKRILKQRNKLLFELSTGDRTQYELLEVWNQKLIETAAFIIHKRCIFSKIFAPMLTQSYESVSKGIESIGFAYAPFGFSNEEISELYQNDFPTNIILSVLQYQLQKFREKEIERGTTLFGPHKDDFQIFLNNAISSEVASQGQSKSILVALKYAEIEYLQKHKGTNPVVLFDDIFSELDLDRTERVLSLMNELKIQLMITTTDLSPISSVISKFETYGIFKVDSGKVEKLSLIHS